jgi:hypothetical protein
VKTVLVIAIGTVAMALLTALARVPARRSGYAFTATLSGDVNQKVSGDATFSRIQGGIGAPTVFTLNLGQESSRAAVLFTRMNSARLSRGTYVISDRWDGTDDILALVLLGPAARPTGVFRGQSGTLTITSDSESVLTGSFTLEASGFTAADPDHDGRMVSASGSFTATGK